MARAMNQAVFRASMLPDRKQPWSFFGVGFGLQVAALSALIVLPMMFPEKMDLARKMWMTPVAAPPVTAWKPQPVAVEKPKPAPVKKAIAKVEPKPKPEIIEPPKPKIYTPVITTPVAKPVVRKQQQAPDMAQVEKSFPTDPVTMGSSAIPNLKKPRELVQTGGFGDPNGLPAKGNPNKAANVAQVGGFDMPTGPGVGNGTGGAKGAKGVVASTGFGNEVAKGSSGTRGSVQQTDFGDATPATAAHVKQTAVVSSTKPVEILFKPKPAYTDEARAKKIEGEVLLKVLFTASGEVKVLQVERGLGFGLDESAEAAARQIRFHPAEQDGQPVDSPAIVHIKFAMAD